MQENGLEYELLRKRTVQKVRKGSKVETFRQGIGQVCELPGKEPVLVESAKET